MAKIDQDFFLRDTKTVAQELLGHRLVMRQGDNELSGTIVETEAYLGLKDPACHSYHGKITDRTQVFYNQGGTVYVYLIYGMYHCLNFITGDQNTPEAVLIRAVEPDNGVEIMKANRLNKPEKQLCSGPGKLCQAFAIDMSHHGQPLSRSPFNIEEPKKPHRRPMGQSPRVGLSPKNPAHDWPLRYFLADSEYLSPAPKLSK